jgi:hypothetical protein
MLKVFTAPIGIGTASGRVLVGYSVQRCEEGEPWWTIYRVDCGRCFTAMLPNLEPTG